MSFGFLSRKLLLVDLRFIFSFKIHFILHARRLNYLKLANRVSVRIICFFLGGGNCSGSWPNAHGGSWSSLPFESQHNLDRFWGEGGWVEKAHFLILSNAVAWLKETKTQHNCWELRGGHSHSEPFRGEQKCNHCYLTSTPKSQSLLKGSYSVIRSPQNPLKLQLNHFLQKGDVRNWTIIQYPLSSRPPFHSRTN